MVKINACKVVITLLTSISILRDGTGITCLHMRLMNSEITFKVLTFQTCSVLKRCKIIRFQKRKWFSLAAKRELDKYIIIQFSNTLMKKNKSSMNLSYTALVKVLPFQIMIKRSLDIFIEIKWILEKHTQAWLRNIHLNKKISQ